MNKPLFYFAILSLIAIALPQAVSKPKSSTLEKSWKFWVKFDESVPEYNSVKDKDYVITIEESETIGDLLSRIKEMCQIKSNVVIYCGEMYGVPLIVDNSTQISDYIDYKFGRCGYYIHVRAGYNKAEIIMSNMKILNRT